MDADKVDQDRLQSSASTFSSVNGQNRSTRESMDSRKKDTAEELKAYEDRQEKRWVKLWQTKIGPEMPHTIEGKTELCAELRKLVVKCDRDSLPGKMPPFFLLLCCFSIQHHLRKNGRNDRIFYDEEYDSFVQVLTQYLDDNYFANYVGEDEDYPRGTIWDKYLAKIGELCDGEPDTPETLLFTLVYYNYKYFNLSFYEEHANLNFNRYEICKAKRRSEIGSEIYYLTLDGNNAVCKKGEEEPAAQHFRKLFVNYQRKCWNDDIPGPFYRQWKSDEESGYPSKWFLDDQLTEEQLKRMLSRARTISWYKKIPKEFEVSIGRSIKAVKHVYKMNYPKGGLAVIFNQENFTIPKLEPRPGTDRDVSRLCEVLDEMKFEFQVHNDFTEREIIKQINLLAKEDYSERSCLMVFVLTHGNYNGDVAAKDRFYDPEILWESFTSAKVRSLANKPKIFVMQACRGRELERGATPGKRKRSASVELDSAIFSTRISSKADFLVAFSCSPGYVSVREPGKGTWFIQTLCSVLEEHHGKEDILSMMTMVCDEVSSVEVYYPEKKKLHGKKQTPVMQSTLRKKVYFNSEGSIDTSEEEGD